MKILAVFLMLLSVTQIASTQVKVTDFTEFELKGHVKRVIEYDFFDSDDKDADTVNYSKRTISTFDKNGYPIAAYSSLRLKFYSGLDSFSYTNSGDTLITRKQYLSGDTSTIYLYKYDNQGHELSFDTYVKGNKHLNPAHVKFLYKYDDKGNRVIQDQHNDEFGLMSSDTLYYNSNGQLIERHSISSFSNTPKYTKTIYDLDANGREIKISNYNINGEKLLSNSISYFNTDSNGNWLVMVNGKHVVKRYIEYY